MNRRRDGRGRNPMVYGMVLQALGEYAQLRNKPPVTGGLILANVAAFYRPGPLDHILPDRDDVCLHPSIFLQTLDLKRLLLSAFYHLDETHLTYNMVSLLWKGNQLESRLGSKKFASTMAVLLLLSHGCHVILSKLLATFSDWTRPFDSECAIGFSSVLFAMKTILNASEPTHSLVLGFLVPTRYAAWVELLVIQLMVPGTSFVGHLSGILAGLLYLHANKLRQFARPVHSSAIRLWRWLLGSIPGLRSGFGSGRGRTLGSGASQPRPAPRSSAGRVGDTRGGGPTARGGGPARGASRFGGSPATDPAVGARRRGVTETVGVWRCRACTFDNTFATRTCGICGALPASRGSGWEGDMGGRGRSEGGGGGGGMGGRSERQPGWSFEDYVPTTRSDPDPAPSLGRMREDRPSLSEAVPPGGLSLDELRQRRLSRFSE